MEPEHIFYLIFGIFAVLAFIALIIFITSYVCFYLTFYSPISRKQKDNGTSKKVEFIFKNHQDVLDKWTNTMKSLNYEDVYIKSFDGLTLHAKYYKAKDGAPVEILFHGYKGSADRDMNGAVIRAIEGGRNALAVDQRAGGTSGGTVISFGINECRDSLKWIDYVIESIDKDAKIILCGVSMGASTVLNATGFDLPKNVACVLGDCGYTSAKEMIFQTIKEMHLSPKIMYPFVRMGARLYGHFNIDEFNTIDMVKKSKTPTIIFHGDSDTFVPSSMGQRLYDNCSAENKRLVLIKGAGHAAAYLVETELYKNEYNKFLDSVLGE